VKIDLDNLTPREIVRELDRYIIGQGKAKRAVAIALRNRLRRRKLPPELRDEVAPKNIIMIGPTGVGKTEIARRIARLCGAPFVKVEASKYTEVGYVGRDVESMIRDLMSMSVSMVRAEMQEGVREEAARRVEEGLLDLLLPGVGAKSGEEAGDAPSATREKFRRMLRDRELEERLVEVDVTRKASPSMQVFSGTTFEEMDINLGNLGSIFGQKKKKKRVTVAQARVVLLAEEMDRLVDMDRVTEEAKSRVEEMGIVFIDEIDKIASREGGHGGPDVSREGVQRDILPIVEGSAVNTRYGMVDTTHILFIAAGAFHMTKPSDLIPELQGRFPLRVELSPLSKDDLTRILTQPENALLRQYSELLATENVKLEFDEGAIERISQIASDVNSKSENIGARRLHTIMELLLEEVSFSGPEIAGQTVRITKEYVDERLGSVIEDRDLTRFIL
jgi:ATP-dependent HslUV protease ATP-binding subunit HslU